MTLAMIVAHDPNLVVGKGGGLPWHYSEDLKYFKNTTVGHSLLMGRRVFESMNEKPLPNRENVVLSRSKKYQSVPTFASIHEALDYLKDEELIFIIGGGEIYRQMIDQTNKLFVTEIHKQYDGDTTFPEYRDKVGLTWQEIKRDDREELSFVVYKRM